MRGLLTSIAQLAGLGLITAGSWSQFGAGVGMMTAGVLTVAVAVVQS